MSRKQHTLTVVLSLIAGLVGGMVSSQFFMGQPVYAEKKPTQEKVVRAEKFELVDKNNKVVARMRHEKRTTFWEMLSENGNTSFSVSSGHDMVTLDLGNKDITGTISLVVTPVFTSLYLDNTNMTMFGVNNRKENSSVSLSTMGTVTTMKLVAGGHEGLVAQMDSQTDPDLQLFDRNRRRRIYLGLVRQEPTLIFLNEKEEGFWVAP